MLPILKTNRVRPLPEQIHSRALRALQRWQIQFQRCWMHGQLHEPVPVQMPATGLRRRAPWQFPQVLSRLTKCLLPQQPSMLRIAVHNAPQARHNEWLLRDIPRPSRYFAGYDSKPQLQPIGRREYAERRDAGSNANRWELAAALQPEVPKL